MADSKFQQKLNSLLESEVIRENDFVVYIRMLNDLTELLERENGFHIYAGVVKNWISGFRTIFIGNKTGNNSPTLWQTLISKSCDSVTKIFFTLLQCFRQFEPNYTQEFYIHWKTIVSCINRLNRADCFQAHADKFKIVIQHLRTAVQRCEQFTILSVLRLYIECVPIRELGRLKEHDNVQIVDLLIKFMDNPTILNQHALLHDVDALGHCIESMKPTKIICKKLKVEMDDSKYEMWLDFNKKDKSIIFCTVSLADCDNQTFGIASRVKLRENVYDCHLLEVNGIWNVISIDNSEPIEKRVTFKFFLLERTEQSISKSVKNTFRFVNAAVATASSQGFGSDHSATEVPERNASFGRAPRLDDSFRSVIPPKLIPIGRSERRCSLQLPPKPLQSRLNDSLPIIAAQPIDSNFTYVIRKSVESVPVTNGTSTHPDSDEPNAMYVLRESVNPIATEQPENDCDSQGDNYNEISMHLDTECPPIQPVVEVQMPSSVQMTDRNDADASSKLLFRDDLFLGEDDGYDDLENDIPNEMAEPQSGSAYMKSGKKIEIIENITIVPPAAQIESLESMQYTPWKGNIRFLQFSQVDERVSFNRKEAFNDYSQPTTSKEKFYVKGSSSGQSRNIGNIRSSESVRLSSHKAIEVSPTKIHSGNQNGIVEQLGVSTDETQQTQTVSQSPVEFSSQSQYNVLVPLATSIQRSVKPRKASQTSQLSQGIVENTNSSADIASSMKINKTSDQTELISQGNRTRETSQTIDKKIEIDAGIKLSSVQSSQEISSQNLLQKQAMSTDSPKRTKCIAIVDLPKMIQSHGRSAIGFPSEPKLSRKESKTTSKLASTENSSQRQATSPLEQYIARVPIIYPCADVKSTAISLKLSRKRTKLPKSQVQSASEQNYSVSEATPNETSTQTSWHKEDASSFQQTALTNYLESSPEKSKRIKWSESPMQSASAYQSIQMSETATTQSLRNSSEKQAKSPQSFDNVTIIDLPKNKDSSLILSQKQTMSDSQNASPMTIASLCEPSSSENPKISAATTQNIVKESSENKVQPTNVTKMRSLNPNTIKKLLTATAKQLPKEESKYLPRYSSLKHTKPAVPISHKRSSQNVQTTSLLSGAQNECNAFEFAECSDGKTSNDEYVITDNIRVDDQGTVYDDKGCVFTDNDELQCAAKFYLANDGLNYLKKDDVKVLPPSKREKYERKLRTVQRMIDRGLDGLRAKDTKINDINPYARTIADDTIQREKRKRRIKEVSVTLSEKRTIVDSARKVTFARRTSKLFYIVDEGTSSNSTSPQSTISKKKTMSKAKKLLNKTKTAQTVKTPQPFSVNLTSGRDGNGQKESILTPSSKRPDAGPSSKCDLSLMECNQPSMRDDCAGDKTTTPKMLPIYASSKMDAKQQQHYNDVSSTSAAKICPPIYASEKMVQAYQKKMKLNPPQLRGSDELPSLASVSTDGLTISNDLSENIPEVCGPRRCEIERELCSTITCNNNLKDLIAHLNEIVMDTQGSCEQSEINLKALIDRFRPNPTIFDCIQRLSGLLKSLESMCDKAEQVPALQETNALSK